MNPDCRDGKHDSCSGTGLNEETDQVEECICPCHDPNHDHVHMSLGDLQWGETADNAGKIAEEEPALEGSVVVEGERIRPARCDRCTMGSCDICNGLRWDFMSLKIRMCECEHWD